MIFLFCTIFQVTALSLNHANVKEKIDHLFGVMHGTKSAYMLKNFIGTKTFFPVRSTMTKLGRYCNVSALANTRTSNLSFQEFAL